MFLYILMEAATSSTANVGTKNKRGFYAALYAGMADRDLDLKINKEKFLESKLNKILKLDPRNGDLIDAFTKSGVIGLRDTFYIEGHLGYGWRVRNFWIGLDAFLGIEPREIQVKLVSSMDDRRDFSIFEFNKQCAISGGAELSLGYYITSSTALLGLIGLEIGKQGEYTTREEQDANKTEYNYLPDAGIRLGLEVKIDVTEKASIKLGYHYSHISSSLLPKKNKDNLKNKAIDHLTFYKYRVSLGVQYHFNGG